MLTSYDIIDFLKDESRKEDHPTVGEWVDALEDADVLHAMAEAFGVGDDDAELITAVEVAHDTLRYQVPQGSDAFEVAETYDTKFPW